MSILTDVLNDIQKSIKTDMEPIFDVPSPKGGKHTYKTEFPELAKALDANPNIDVITVSNVSFHDWAIHLIMKSGAKVWIDAGDESSARTFNMAAPYYIAVDGLGDANWSKNEIEYEEMLKIIGELK